MKPQSLKLLAFVSVVLLITVAATVAAIEDKGYVLISRADWSIELSLVLFLLLTLLMLPTIYATGYLIWKTLKLRQRWDQWRDNKQLQSANRSLFQGLLHLAEGNWPQAESCLIQNVPSSHFPVINYIGAAYASQQQHKLDDRDSYLKKAADISPTETQNIGFITARLQHMAGQHEQERATLLALHDQDPQHEFALRQLLHVHSELSDWSKVIDLAPAARKKKAISRTEIDELELKAHNELLKLSLPSASLDTLRTAWGGVPADFRDNPGLVASYARQLLQQDHSSDAETLLRKTIDKQWNEQLAAIYGHSSGDQPEKQLATAERWLESHPDSTPLKLTVAKLADVNGFADKALKLVNTILDHETNVEASLLKAGILEKQGKTGQAMETYRQALQTLCENNYSAC